MKVMISLPMDSKTDEEINAEMNKIKEKLNELHIEVVDSNFKEDAPENCQHPGLYFMAKSINMMSRVDAVFFHKDWRYARGCRIEREICRVYGVKILDWNFVFETEENIRYRNRFYADGKEIEEEQIKEKSLDNDSIIKTRDIVTYSDNHIPHLD